METATATASARTLGDVLTDEQCARVGRLLRCPVGREIIGHVLLEYFTTLEEQLARHGLHPKTLTWIVLAEASRKGLLETPGETGASAGPTTEADH